MTAALITELEGLFCPFNPDCPGGFALVGTDNFFGPFLVRSSECPVCEWSLFYPSKWRYDATVEQLAARMGYTAEVMRKVLKEDGTSGSSRGDKYREMLIARAAIMLHRLNKEKVNKATRIE